MASSGIQGYTKPLHKKHSICHNHSRAYANWRQVAVKTKALGFFNRHNTDKNKRRSILNGFMERMKTQMNMDQQELDNKKREYDGLEGNVVIRTMRPRSPNETKVRKTPEGPTWKKYEVKPGSKCAICDCVFPAFHEHEALPCRICDDVFHRQCLDKCGDLHTADKYNIEMAKTNVGWSCPQCSNISLLMTTEEINEMTEQFDSLDFNKDAQVSVEEYLKHNARRASLVDGRGDLIQHDREHLMNEHKRMDQNGDGYLDWWEFVNQESKLYLMKKDKRDLVDLLTNKELMAAKAVFRKLDTDGDGKIKHCEAKEAYLKWYRRFEPGWDPTRDEDPVDSESVDLHASISAMCIMDADTAGTGEVQWKDFILDQALYIICCRPNYRSR